MVLVFMYLNFSGLWAYREVEFVLDQRIFNVAYLFALTLPMLLFMLSVSVLIDSEQNELSDWNATYLAASSRFYVILALAVAAALLPDLIPGVSFAPSPIPSLLLIGFFVLLAAYRNVVVHVIAHSAFWICTCSLLVFWVLQAFLA